DGTLLLGGSHSIDIVLVKSGAFVALRDATIGGVRRFDVSGTLLTISEQELSVYLNGQSNSVVIFENDASVWGTGGRANFIASPGTMPVVFWNDAWLHRGTVTDSVLVFVRGASLSLTGGESNLGDIEVDPAGDSIEISGTIGSQATVHVNRVDSGGTASVHFRNLD